MQLYKSLVRPKLEHDNYRLSSGNDYSKFLGAYAQIGRVGIRLNVVHILLRHCIFLDSYSGLAFLCTSVGRGGK